MQKQKMFEVELNPIQSGIPFNGYSIKEVSAEKEFKLMYYIEDDGRYLELGKNVFETYEKAADEIFNRYRPIVKVIRESENELVKNYNREKHND